MIGGVTSRSLHWDPNGRHGGALLGDTRNEVVRFASTGSTRRAVQKAV